MNKDFLDLKEAEEKAYIASKELCKALGEERDANTLLKQKEYQVELDNMEALCSKEMSAATHKIKVGHETFNETLRLTTAKTNRKIYDIKHRSLDRKYYLLKLQSNIR